MRDKREPIVKLVIRRLSAVGPMAMVRRVGWYGVARVIVLGCLGFAVAAVVMVALRRLSGSSMVSFIGGQALTQGWFAYLLLVPSAAALRRRVVALTWYGRCGQCTFSLRGLPPESDGCVVCPECGAAWRRDQIAPANVQDAVAIEATQPVTRLLGVPFAQSTITDALMRPLVLANRDLSNVDLSVRTQLPAAVRARVDAAAGGPLLRGSLIAVNVLVGVTSVVMTTAILFFGLYQFQSVFEYVLLSAGAFFPVLPAALGTYALLRPGLVVRRRHFARAMLRDGLCPSCARSELVSIDGLDSYTTCAHCGGTWAAHKFI